MSNPSFKQYSNPDCVKFVKDMKKNGKEVVHYHGRSFWEGPAVIFDNLQDGLSATRVKCQWDNMGNDFVTYPKEKDAGVNV
jgi:hypothetical protein